MTNAILYQQQARLNAAVLNRSLNKAIQLQTVSKGEALLVQKAYEQNKHWASIPPHAFSPKKALICIKQDWLEISMMDFMNADLDRSISAENYPSLTNLMKYRDPEYTVAAVCKIIKIASDFLGEKGLTANEIRALALFIVSKKEFQRLILPECCFFFKELAFGQLGPIYKKLDVATVGQRLIEFMNQRDAYYAAESLQNAEGHKEDKSWHIDVVEKLLEHRNLGDKLEQITDFSNRKKEYKTLEDYCFDQKIDYSNLKVELESIFKSRWMSFKKDGVLPYAKYTEFRAYHTKRLLIQINKNQLLLNPEEIIHFIEEDLGSSSILTNKH